MVALEETGFMYDNQAAQFAEEGYAVFEGVLVGPMLDLLREQCQGFIAREDARMDALGVDSLGISHRGRRYFANECQRTQPALRTMLFSPVMAEVCRATLGEDAYFFFDQYVVKGPDGGMPFAWHQDSGYVRTYGGPEHRPYLTCWCPLDDATTQNGTVRLLPFSAVPASRDAVLPHAIQAGANDLVGWTGSEEGVVVEARAGSIVAFSSHLLHATGSNQTERMRRVYLAQYTPEVILDPGTRHLRRNAIPLLRGGEQVTLG
jgi:ectoine hydroxylase-related dioxygenase (phytanoyl-CoA dioxygenase family)